MAIVQMNKAPAIEPVMALDINPSI